MNPLPPNADELVSAYLDGEAAPHEIDIVESNEALMDRVHSLRGLTSGLAAPLTPPIEQKEAHLAAALGAFDELFGTESGAAATSAAAPVLAVVPDPATAPPVQAQTTVTSLAKARERRRPRRFNTGLIAAAIAAVLLIGSIAALSGGRTQDVANSAAADTAETADDTGDASDEASNAEAAMDDAMEGAAALELDASRSAAPAAPVPAQAAESFASDEAAVDDAGDAMAESEPEASDDDAAADSAASADSATSPLAPPFDDFLGNFETEDELLLKVAPPNLREFEARYDLVENGLFPGCQQEVPELRIIETPTLLGTATLNGLPVEVHILPGETGDLSLFVVATRGCVPVPPTS